MSADTRPAGDATLSVENLGPVSRAELDLRPLNVFVGPANTGKSFLATLVHALCAHCRENPGPLRAPRPGGAARLSGEEREALLPWLAGLQEAGRDTPGDAPALPGPVAKAVRRSLSEPAGVRDGIGDTLGRYFGTRDLCGRGRDRPAHPARVEVLVPDTSSRLVIEIGPDAGAVSVRGDVPPSFGLRPPPHMALEGDLRRLLRGTGAEADPGRLREAADAAYGQLLRHAFSEAFRPLVRASHYLPGNRAGVMGALNVFIRALATQAAGPVPDPARDAPGLPGVLADFLQGLVSKGRGEGTLAEFARGLETDLLDGAIIEEWGELPDLPAFFYRPKGMGNGKAIPLAGASSTVSELAPVVLFLRKFVREGDILVIEEPESHLHPALQAQLAPQLARLARLGVRVILTTNSEWILEQLANLVGMSTLGDRGRAEFESDHPYLAGACIPEEQVGVWLFSPGEASGSVVEEIGLDKESGLFPVRFDDVGVDLYNHWAEIYSKLTEAMENDGR